MADLKTSISLRLYDHISRPFKALNRTIKTTSAELDDLAGQRKLLATTGKLAKKLGTTGSRLDLARRETKRLAAELRAAENPSKKLQSQFRKSQKAVRDLARSHKEAKSQLKDLVPQLREAGLSYRNMADSVRKLDRRESELTSTLRRRRRAQRRLNRGLARARSAFPHVARRSGLLALGGVGAGIEVFRRTFLETAKSFEVLESSLANIQGSSEAARSSMKWIGDFASRTPFELETVADAFKKMASYGIDPAAGLLSSAGDAAAAMGKSLDQAVEAVADALTGENERLKEFGIRTSTEGGVISYRYQLHGREQIRTAAADDMAAISATLEGIFDERFSGSMLAQSKTFEGMLSNLSDHWQRFQLTVMRAGVFDRLKETLAGILGRLNQWAESGQMEVWAQSVAGWIGYVVDRLQAAWEWTKYIAGLAGDLAVFVGGWRNLAGILAGLKVTQLAVSFASLVVPLVASTTAAGGLAGAIGAVTLAALPWIGIAAAVGAAAFIIWRNWEPLTAWFRKFWEGLTADFYGWLDGIVTSDLSFMFSAERVAAAQERQSRRNFAGPTSAMLTPVAGPTPDMVASPSLTDSLSGFAPAPAAQLPTAPAPAAQLPTAPAPAAQLPTTPAPAAQLPTAPAPAAQLPTTPAPAAPVVTQNITVHIHQREGESEGNLVERVLEALRERESRFSREYSFDSP